MMMLMRRRHSIGGVVVVSFRAFLVAAYRGGGDFLPLVTASVVRE